MGQFGGFGQGGSGFPQGYPARARQPSGQGPPVLSDPPLLGVRIPGAARPGCEYERDRFRACGAPERGMGTRRRRGAITLVKFTHSLVNDSFILMEALFRLPAAVRRDPKVEAWFFDLTDPFRLIAREWFLRMRRCGDDVHEILHYGSPTACVGDAAFAYVSAFSGHAAVGFFHGSSLPDPSGLLEGTGKRMRHVKLRPGRHIDERALERLIRRA